MIKMGKTGRDTAILVGVEGGLIAAAYLLRRVLAKPPELKPGATIRGIVLDQQTEFYIPFAKLEVEGVPISVNGEGRFYIGNLPLGEYTVTASAPGYRSITLTWEITETKDYVIEVELVPIETLW